MTPEQWRPIAGYAGIYEVSDQGRVRSLARQDRFGRPVRERVLRPVRQMNGYLNVTLCSAGLDTPRGVHRLVCEAFLPGDPERPQANHINGRKDDNQLANLEWASASENRIHAIASGLCRLPRTTTPVIGRRVSDGEERWFESLQSAARAMGVNAGGIHGAITGRQRAVAGYEWRRA